MANFPADRDVFWDSLGEAGAKVYFTGHDHLFDHLRMMDGEGNWIHQYIVGTAGAPMHTWTGVYPDSRVEGISHIENNGYSMVEVAGDSFTVYFKERTAPGVYTQAADVSTFTVGTNAVKPTADFSASDMSGAIPLEVRFQDESITGTNPITSWTWDFGDGGVSHDPTPIHTYTQAGFYDVTLTVSNDDGGDTITRKEYISVGLPVWGCFGSGFAIAGLLGFATRRMRKTT
jgi:PKD repeat protein